ncbi:hypothetical protein SDC9_112316 [bioreactor metagenome]|uniref:Uncharacterized protein n=1 Tax=bioreactor metagenome TaxID=1076179 RepID=A0A645BIX5_9ZZZZ
MEFIENHQPYPGKLRIVLQLPGQHTLGHHFEAGCGRHFALQPHPVAHGPAELVAMVGRQLGRDRISRNPARFEHPYPAPLKPRRIQQRQRQHCAFARPGRRG